jgi:NosR/NirI family nitrous oxide reductase transcriptional regulator
MRPETKGVLIIILVGLSLVFYEPLHSTVVAFFHFLSEFSQVVTGEQERHLKEVLPEADVFSSKEGDLPHYKGYQIDPATNLETLVGFAFFTTQVQPRHRGYKGPIEIAVGMNTEGIITGIKVVDHDEPYGYFSIDLPSFSVQFNDKSILDPFRVELDIDGVSRATITIASSTRSIKNSARGIAKQYLEQIEGQNRD